VRFCKLSFNYSATAQLLATQLLRLQVHYHTDCTPTILRRQPTPPPTHKHHHSDEEQQHHHSHDNQHHRFAKTSKCYLLLANFWIQPIFFGDKATLTLLFWQHSVTTTLTTPFHQTFIVLNLTKFKLWSTIWKEKVNLYAIFMSFFWNCATRTTNNWEHTA
jgi:hypothetical protein